MPRSGSFVESSHSSMGGMRTAVFVIAMTTAASAQWLRHPTDGLPRLADGRPNLTAPTPRTPDGKPDLSGIWRAVGYPCEEGTSVTPDILRPRYFVSAAGCRNPDLPMQPWAAELFKRRYADRSKDLPMSSCKPAATPMRDAFPLPFKIVQATRLIVFLYEQDTTFRQVFLDGRTLPRDPNPSWLGYSVGRWEGDDLVVETTGFHDQGWLDGLGHPYSDALHMTERFRRINTGRLDIDVTFDDPKTYTRPIKFTQPHDLFPDTELLEFFCTENQKFRPQ